MIKAKTLVAATAMALVVSSLAPVAFAEELVAAKGGVPGAPTAPANPATPATGKDTQAAPATGKDGAQKSAPDTQCTPTSTTTPSTTTPSTTTTTTPSTTTTTDTSTTATTTPSTTTTDSSTSCQGSQNHLDAVQKVMVKLQDKLTHLNPTAAANVADVISRMEAELKAGGVATDDKSADAQVESSLKAKATAGTAQKSDLDVLAAVQTKQGKDADAQATMEQRIAKDPTDKDGYTALSQQLTKDGKPADITTFVAGKKPNFDVKPFIRDGRTLVPVRAIVEALGADVKWDPATRTVTITKDGTTVSMVIGANTATINGKEVTLDVPPGIENSRTVIPVRFVAEMLGLHVEWNPTSQMIVITKDGTTSGGTDATSTTTPSTGTTTPSTGTTTP